MVIIFYHCLFVYDMTLPVPSVLLMNIQHLKYSSFVPHVRLDVLQIFRIEDFINHNCFAFMICIYILCVNVKHSLSVFILKVDTVCMSL